MATLLESHTGEWTSADLDLLPDHWKAELLDGTLIVNAKPTPIHDIAAQRLVRILERALDPALEPVTDIMLDLGTAELAPDVAVVERDRIDVHANVNPASVARLVVEVTSPSTATIDRTIKPERYAAAGIAGYWRVELDPITVIAYVLRDGTYAAAGTWHAGETVEVDEPFPISFDPAALRR